MNKLQFETSPYLLQHKDNPVDWHPYNEEALELARKLDKPIFLSIGYSSCHWCHIMEKESFEDPEIAKIMNELFVNIKVDREERPDIDNIYMNYVQMLTGSGGWPLSVFLAPDLKPIFGGTYFPKTAKYGKPSFKDVLIAVAKAYREKKKEIYESSEDVVKALSSLAKINTLSDEFTKEEFSSLTSNILKSYDSVFGGFGSAPKFPMIPVLNYLLLYRKTFKDEQALTAVEHTLKMMLSGGIYDQIGGGLARYSTDPYWIVPHFEKMLYDNAQLISILCLTYQASQDIFYLNAADDVANFLIREMLSPEGGFYSAIDADSENEEGKFYVFDYDELKEILNEKELELAKKFYGITEKGNFDGKNILTSRCNISEIMNKSELSQNEFYEIMSAARTKIFKYRMTRQRPLTDDKINSAWNSLTISAFSKLYLCSGKHEYLGLALKTADFILKNLFNNNILYTTYKNGKCKGFGCLDSYSYFILALINLYEASMIEEYLGYALKLFNLSIDKFYSKDDDVFFYSPIEAKDILIRTVDIYDNALPSGISQLLLAYEKLKNIYGLRNFEDMFYRQYLKIKNYALKYPLGFGSYLSFAISKYSNPKTIVLSGDTSEIKKFKTEFFNNFYPFDTLIYNVDEVNTSLPIAQNKNSSQHNLTIFVCENFSCKKPIYSFDEFQKMFDE